MKARRNLKTKRLVKSQNVLLHIKEDFMSKKNISFLFVLTGAFFVSIATCYAKSNFGTEVNTACAPAAPYVGDCALCHSGSYGNMTAAMDAYKAGGTTLTDFFCPAGPTCTDNDGDTFALEGGDCGPMDCNDSDPAINPGAAENCTDGIDNDCDNLVDMADGDAVNCPALCTDNDGDGYAVEGAECGPVDCNDSDFAINPGATEDCTDGIDNDCDNLIDIADGGAVDCPVVCTDNDGDGYAVEGAECGLADCDDTDAAANPGAPGSCGDIPVTGDWDGTGTSKIGVYRDGIWFLDLNGNNEWDGTGPDESYTFGLASDIPVTGDWDGTGSSRIGVYRKGVWYLDIDGDGFWDGAGTDSKFAFGNSTTDIPVTGDWNGTGTSRIGVYRDGTWFLDLNGNGVWDGQPTDSKFLFGGLPSDIPVTGDWDGNGITEVGIYRDGTWFLDLNGGNVWDGQPTDRKFTFGGLPGDIPVTGDWNGDGITEVGVYRDSTWFLDLNDSGAWDGNTIDAKRTF